ncbi:MAG TPA: alpha/beta hydrolase-fold protein, partial [Gemmatimonadaceae bacterium]
QGDRVPGRVAPCPGSRQVVVVTDGADSMRKARTLVASAIGALTLASACGHWTWLPPSASPRTTIPNGTHAEAPSSYCVRHQRYDDYVARDVVRYVDSHYRTQADRAHRGIGGLSMGGYGALSLALRFPDVFSAAASHSGMVSPM